MDIHRLVVIRAVVVGKDSPLVYVIRFLLRPSPPGKAVNLVAGVEKCHSVDLDVHLCAFLEVVGLVSQPLERHVPYSGRERRRTVERAEESGRYRTNAY